MVLRHEAAPRRHSFPAAPVVRRGGASGDMPDKSSRVTACPDVGLFTMLDFLPCLHVVWLVAECCDLEMTC